MDNKLRIGAVYALLAVAVVALLMANAERSFDLTDVFGIAAMVAVGSIMAFLIFRRPRVAVWGSGLTAFVAVVAVQLAVGDERREAQNHANVLFLVHFLGLGGIFIVSVAETGQEGAINSYGSFDHRRYEFTIVLLIEILH